MSTPTPQALQAPKALRGFSATGYVGLVIVIGIMSTAIVSFFWTPYDPLHVDPALRLAAPSWQHLCGTDRYGRDIFSQLMVGARITLFVGVIAVAVAACFGIPLGIYAGMRRGLAEILIMRGADLFLAFPALLMAIIASAIFGGSTLTAMIAIGIASVPAFARVCRSATLSVMTRDFIAASYSAGKSNMHVALRHVVPNIMGVIIVQASIAFALAILAEAGLSFLGLGTAPPTPSWGRMLQAAGSFLSSAPHLALAPGGAIAVSVLGFNLLGDGLRDNNDPRA
ncbi:ABC transporter permease [Corynebacterium sp. sy039]|uniref:ABC transporter permease n=1 Tax=Corynebacterium sp. sy039 TaxID=2599641 RepID=UPI0011B4FE26|nr:ABC transporter permease [Corynebacterium sp. sy039]